LVAHARGEQAHRLERAGVIRERGYITVLDEEALESAAGYALF
jgi:hypothetical protein